MRLRLKPILPRSLYGRAALILIVPIVTIQLVVSTAFIQRHFERVTEQMTRGILIDILHLRDEVTAARTLTAAQTGAGRVGRALQLEVVLPDETLDGGPDRRDRIDLSGRTVILTLREGLPEVIAIDLVTEPRWPRVVLSTEWGPMAVSFDRRRVSASNPHQLLVLMIVTSVLMTGIAYAFLSNQLRPIKRLANAAEAFGRGIVIPYRPRGAIEVRAAGHAFLDMRARIERQIEQRTLMLSGVSHDLRTPLTRMRLGLSLLPEDDEVRALLGDVAQMERMVDEFLAFARGDAMENAVPSDVGALVRRIVEDGVRAGQAVELGPVQAGGPLALRPQALTRALENLIANAVRHGTRARVGVQSGDGYLRISVEDDGPGIPKDLRDEALLPFARLDGARNPNSGGGAGLGLSIAADIARSHGGTLRLGESEAMGGLRADLVLAR